MGLAQFSLCSPAKRTATTGAEVARTVPGALEQRLPSRIYILLGTLAPEPMLSACGPAWRDAPSMPDGLVRDGRVGWRSECAAVACRNQMQGYSLQCLGRPRGRHGLRDGHQPHGQAQPAENLVDAHLLPANPPPPCIGIYR